MRICDILTKIFSFLPTSQLSMMETTCLQGTGKSTGLLTSVHIHKGHIIFSGRDGISHPVLSYLLLRLSSG